MIGLLIVGGIAGFVLYLFYEVMKVTFLYFFGDEVNRHYLFKKLKPAYKTAISRDFSYYKKLNRENREIFERRLQKFIDMKEFVPKGGLKEVTDDMKALIGASAIQITFGLPSIYLEHFDQILVYPDTYLSTITDHYHKGEVNSVGIIVLSWSNFVKGYLDDSDGRNLALHEMSHALKIEDYTSDEAYNFFDQEIMLQFIKETRLEAQRILNGEPSFFREYAASNDHEFFAVVIENFFERPQEFKKEHFGLYKLTTQLLNQDPLVLACG